MADASNSLPSHEDRADALIAEYLRRVDAGDDVDVEQLAAALPEAAAELREFVAGESLFGGPQDDDVVDPSSSSAAAAPPSESITRSRAIDETVAPRRRKKRRPPAAPAEEDEQPKRTFGRFLILKRLGQGAMGTVFLAEDSQLGRQVALKIPRLTGNDNAEFIERFHREARAAAGINHANVCSVYDIGEENGTPFFAMEFIDGKPLSEFVGTPELKDEQRIVRLLIKIARGLAEAHRQGVVHRDLKPGNIVINRRGEPIVTDFGLARRDEGDVRITDDGAVLGTPAYMSPEQVQADHKRVGPQSDVYSLGVILYELTTGELPFSGSAGTVMAQILRDEVPPPSVRREGLDLRLDDLCRRMTARDLSERFASMDDAADAMKDWLHASSPTSMLPASGGVAEQLESEKVRIGELLRAGRYSVAIEALDLMAQLTEPGTETWSQWARRELPRARKLSSSLKRDLPGLIAEAQHFMEGCSYLRAAELLQTVPQAYRSPEIQQILDRALELEEESDLLIADVLEAMRNRQYRGLEENLNRLLELKPRNRMARELKAALGTYRRGQPYRYRDDGSLQPARTPSETRRIWLLAALVLLVGFGLTTWAVTIYLRSGKETLYVKIDDRLLEKGAITLEIDGKTHVIHGKDVHIELKPGEYGYEVRRGDETIVNPDRIVITKKGRNVLEIGRVGVAQSGKDQRRPGSIDAADAEQHEDAKADADPSRVPLELKPVHNWDWDDKLSPWATAFSPDGKQAAAGFKDGAIVLLDVSTAEQRLLNRGATGEILDVAYANDGGSIFATGAEFNGVRHCLINVDPPRFRNAEKGAHAAKVWDVAVSKSGKQFVTAGEDGRCRVWAVSNPGSFELTKTEFRGHGKPVFCAAVSPDGKTVATGGADKRLRLWSIADGRELRSSGDLNEWVWDVDFSPDGRRVVCTAGRRVVVWNVNDLTRNANYKGHGQWAFVSQFTPDGRFIVSGGNDGQLHVWDAATARSHAFLRGHKGGVRSLAISNDGKRALSADDKGSLLLWDLMLDAPAPETPEPLDAPLNTVVNVEFSQTPLKDVARFLSDAAGVQISLAADVDGDAPVTARALRVALRTALERILEPLNLTYRVTGDRVLISRRRTERLELIFSDDFSDPDRHRFPIRRENDRVQTYEKGAYVMELKPGDRRGADVQLPVVVTDFVMEADVRLSNRSGKSFVSINFRDAEPPAAGQHRVLTWEIDGNTFTSLHRRLFQNSTNNQSARELEMDYVVKPRKSPPFKTGVNKLRIEFKGAKLTLTVNDSIFWEGDVATGPGYRPGKHNIALWIVKSNSADSVRLELDDVKVWRINDADLKIPSTSRFTPTVVPDKPEVGPVRTGPQGLRFDGDDAVVLKSLQFDGSHSLTVEAIVQPESAGDQVVLGDWGYHFFTETLSRDFKQGVRRVDNSYRGGFRLGVNRNGQWEFAVCDVSRDVRRATAQSRVRSGRTYHVAGVYSARGLSLFVDGVRQSGGEKVRKGYYPSDAPIMLGAGVDRESQPRNEFKGVVSAARISRGVRYREDFTPPRRFDKDDSTAAVLLFDGASEKTIRDASGNNNHGTIIGAKWTNLKSP